MLQNVLKREFIRLNNKLKNEMPMKTFTNDEDGFTTKNAKFKLGPKKSTLDFLRNFSQTYQVPRTKQIKNPSFLAN